MVEIIDLTQDDDDDDDDDEDNDDDNDDIQPTTSSLLLTPSPPPLSSNNTILLLPNRITPSITTLPPRDHRILLKKRTWLQSHATDTSAIDTSISTTALLPPSLIPSTLVFAQQEAGTAVCISPAGLVLTCAHCIADSAPELDWSAQHWLLFSSGQLVSAAPLAWDPIRDLALLLITKTTSSPSFPHTPISASAPEPRTPLLCTGHPGATDLESASPNAPTNYDTLVLSAGSFRGLSPSQDPQDNAHIGALRHTCWTYWGHSVAPLVRRRDGALVGLHSSWDEATGMRRGVPWEAVVRFLGELRERFAGRAGGEQVFGGLQYI